LAVVQLSGVQNGPLTTTELYRWTASETLRVAGRDALFHVGLLKHQSCHSVAHFRPESNEMPVVFIGPRVSRARAYTLEDRPMRRWQRRIINIC